MRAERTLKNRISTSLIAAVSSIALATTAMPAVAQTATQTVTSAATSTPVATPAETTTATPAAKETTTPSATPTPTSTPAPAAMNGPMDVVLGIGKTQKEANLNWLTAKDVKDQVVQFAPAKGITAENIAAKGTEIKATSTVVNVAEGLTKDEVKKKDATNSTDYGRHIATLTGLKANTEYVYRVGSAANGWSELETFKTGDFDKTWNFLFLGDPQLGSGGHSVPESQEMWINNLKKIQEKAGDFSFIQSAGDQLQLGNKGEHDALTAADQLQSYRFAPINGNHDNYDFEAFRGFYNRPNMQADERNYFYEYNNMLMITLDTNHIDDIDADAAFVDETIKAHGKGKDWIVVTFHHAPYSQANHQDDKDIQVLREKLNPKLSEMGVDLVLSGHDHIYTRSHLMQGNDPVIPEKKPAVGDVYKPNKGEVMYLTANSATGTKFYDFFKDDVDYEGMTREEAEKKGLVQPYTAYWDQQYTPNYTNIKVSGGALKVSTFDIESGELVDEFTLEKENKSGLGSSEGSAVSSSEGPLTAILAVLGAIGGLGWALATGQLHIPGVDVKAELAKLGIRI
ncbi:metallophosphoesterase family protein [Staphylococcus chromogenes]|nr:metallophosphoesterase family protein [Staphylococcus chromogenes]